MKTNTNYEITEEVKNILIKAIEELDDAISFMELLTGNDDGTEERIEDKEKLIKEINSLLS
ncbi:hypothetical protein [Gottfriedia solisilvae]|uniref:hypothetical protein n=1 Tax=Gottfriedia solisilvae TaxID=1516104 RepID=UPI003D2ED357